MKHTIVVVEPSRYHGWPANNGIWIWENEILVGFTQGDYVQKTGHSIDGVQENHLAKSLDGGESWRAFRPEGYFRDEHPRFRGGGKRRLEKPLDFLDPGLTVKVFSQGYHGCEDPEGGFFTSHDRGETWQGPWRFEGLHDHDEMQGKLLSARTAYLSTGNRECLFFISAKPPGESEARNRVGCMRTADGGLSFEFLSWVTPDPQGEIAIMPQAAQLSENRYVMAYRKIVRDEGGESAIEMYRSDDRCCTWDFLSTVKITAPHHNPPALAKLADGRLCCSYGDRSDLKIKARYSEDEGLSWGSEFIVRDDYYRCHDKDRDFGYVSLVQRVDGNLVAVYYWATAENPEQHIAASIWKP
jgi:hypothetical protein